jgi:hypothetical protein
MKSIKLALLGGAALAVTAAAAHADDLDALKAQIETLNARVAAMEAAPSVPAGYSLLTISEGDMKQVPGLDDSNARNLRDLGPKATVISVLPTADAPAGATITWSGRVATSLTYQGYDDSAKLTFSEPEDAISALGLNMASPTNGYSEDGEYRADTDDTDLDILVQARLRVTAATDTAVGEVGVTMEMRGNFNGNGSSDVYFNEAWGWWAMTPELTLGGGYTGSLGNNSYGFDGVCSCYQTDFGDAFSLNPGDTTQMRLSYGSGPFTMAIALEDGGAQGSFGNGSDNYNPNWDTLGVAGKIGYSGDMFNAAISGVWRDVNADSYAGALAAYNAGNFVDGAPVFQVANWEDVEDTWQLNAGVGFGLGDVAKLSLGASIGSGPTTSTYEGQLDTDLPLQNDWWGVSGALVFNLTDEFSAELGAAYKHRETDGGLVIEDASDDGWEFDGTDYDIWAIAGGLYYTPVEQLTLGIEGQWQTADSETSATEIYYGGEPVTGACNNNCDTFDIDATQETWLVDFTGVWRF